VLSDLIYGLYDLPEDVNVELMLDFVRMHFSAPPASMHTSIVRTRASFTVLN